MFDEESTPSGDETGRNSFAAPTTPDAVGEVERFGEPESVLNVDNIGPPAAAEEEDEEEEANASPVIEFNIAVGTLGNVPAALTLVNKASPMPD